MLAIRTGGGDQELVIAGHISAAVLTENQPVTVHEESLYWVLLRRIQVTTRHAKTSGRYELLRIIEPS